jgi:hypothetical protein
MGTFFFYDFVIEKKAQIRYRLTLQWNLLQTAYRIIHPCLQPNQNMQSIPCRRNSYCESPRQKSNWRLNLSFPRHSSIKYNIFPSETRTQGKKMVLRWREKKEWQTDGPLVTLFAFLSKHTSAPVWSKVLYTNTKFSVSEITESLSRLSLYHLCTDPTENTVSNSSSIVAFAYLLPSDPLPSNGHLFLFWSPDFQQTCHNIYRPKVGRLMNWEGLGRKRQWLTRGIVSTFTWIFDKNREILSQGGRC